MLIKDAITQNSSFAAQLIKNKELIAIATDTVYGIAVDAYSEEAVNKIYQIKNRDNKKPIAIFLSSLNQAEELFSFDDFSYKIAKELLPGKFTLVMKLKDTRQFLLAKNLNSNNDSFIGFRFVENNFINDLISKLGNPIAVTSANKSGQTAANSCQKVCEYFTSKELSAIFQNDSLTSNDPSTVIKISNQTIELIRQGSDFEKLKRFL